MQQYITFNKLLHVLKNIVTGFNLYSYSVFVFMHELISVSGSELFSSFIIIINIIPR